MTAKRFNRVGGYVYDGEKCISHFEDVTHRDDIVKLLNELHEENEQLKQAYNDAKKDVEKKEQILKDIMKDNLLMQDIEKELEE